MSQLLPSVAITGIGAVTNFGCGFPVAWSSQLSGAAPVTRPRASQGSNQHMTFTTQAPAAADLEPEFGKLEYPRPSRSSLMALIAAREAWRMANFSSAPNSSRVGVLISRCFGELDIQERYYRTLRQRGPGAVSGLEFVQSLANTVLGRVAMDLGARGPSLLSVGPPVFGLALDALRRHEADVIVAGGVDHLSDFVCDLCNAADLSGQGREGEFFECGTSTRFIPGDGAAFLILERYEYTRERGAHPIAFLRGSATVMDRLHGARGIERSCEDIAASVQFALKDAGTDPGDIAFVSRASAGLPRYDEVELEAIRSSVNPHAFVFSTKAAHGETWGASGALALASAATAIEKGLVPPQTSIQSDRRARIVAGPPRCGISLSFDLPGSNSAFVVSSC
ncbi:MAG TPA: beta-ketoacyl synthase N-terminal-like domain-containing protein [Bryobacteraceae bacterium]|nr:beta-ketoacyl synthase N-terminal-like domain-containing protein [Bryobacteraceae bacterium]